jgi:hypothetical protein
MLLPLGLAALSLFWLLCAQAAPAQPNLSACSLRYGELMAAHWLTVDLAQQIERGLSYQPPTRDPESHAQSAQLQEALAAAEKQLEEARGLYRTAFTTTSPQSLTWLDLLLEQIGMQEIANQKAAKALLQQVGERSCPAPFQAEPVSSAALAPAWDGYAWCDRKYRPRRILFGSTGKVGDDRTLPLRFDFGSGIFGFYIPMAAADRLDIAADLRSRTNAVYGWMKANHTGYHYWAGVYNNQNTYVARWFLQQHTNEDDLWMKLANGKVLQGGEWSQVNIWNHQVRDYLRGYCETQARTLSGDPFLVCYDYTGEPHPFGSQPAGQPQFSGYNESAVVAFRDYLRAKFGRIDKLNRAWHATYASFDSIQPPPDLYLAPPARATPLTYEFERFRCDSHAQLWKMVYDAYRRYDAAKPIAANAGMFMSGWPVEGLDAYQLQKTGVADWIDMHMNNFWPNLAEQIYLYSLCRLSGKVPVEFEYIWTFPRTGPLEDTREADFRTTCLASVWRNLVWGKKVLVFFDFYYDWPAYHNAFLDHDLGYSILRPSACVVPVTKRRALRFNDILMHTEVVTPPIIVLEPTASILNSPQLHPNQSFSYHSQVAGKEVHGLLFPKNYPFLYVPEAAVLDGYALKQHRVIVLPQAPYLPEPLTEQLLKWVKQGGTLISLGVPGIWNPYGQDDLRLVREVFGPSQVTDEGKWNWRWELARGNAAVLEQVRDPQGRLQAALALYGKGRVLVSTGNFQSPELQRLFYEVLSRGLGPKPADCEQNAFELVLRGDERGQRYLFALNPHTRETREAQVTLAGEFRHCADLGVGSGVPVPVLLEDGRTQFRLRLHPGEGTVISLSR